MQARQQSSGRKWYPPKFRLCRGHNFLGADEEFLGRLKSSSRKLSVAGHIGYGTRWNFRTQNFKGNCGSSTVVPPSLTKCFECLSLQNIVLTSFGRKRAATPIACRPQNSTCSTLTPSRPKSGSDGPAFLNWFTDFSKGR